MTPKTGPEIKIMIKVRSEMPNDRLRVFSLRHMMDRQEVRGTPGDPS